MLTYRFTSTQHRQHRLVSRTRFDDTEPRNNPPLWLKQAVSLVSSRRAQLALEAVVAATTSSAATTPVAGRVTSATSPARSASRGEVYRLELSATSTSTAEILSLTAKATSFSSTPRNAKRRITRVALAGFVEYVDSDEDGELRITDEARQVAANYTESAIRESRWRPPALLTHIRAHVVNDLASLHSFCTASFKQSGTPFMDMQSACREASVERLWTFTERMCTNTVDSPKLSTANAVLRATLRARSRKTSYLKDETVSVLYGLKESQQNTLARMGVTPSSRASQRSRSAQELPFESLRLDPLHLNCFIMDDYTTSTRSGAASAATFATSCNTISNVAVDGHVLKSFDLQANLPTSRLINGTMINDTTLAPVLLDAVLDHGGLLDYIKSLDRLPGQRMFEKVDGACGLGRVRVVRISGASLKTKSAIFNELVAVLKTPCADVLGVEALAAARGGGGDGGSGGGGGGGDGGGDDEAPSNARSLLLIPGDLPVFMGITNAVMLASTSEDVPGVAAETIARMRRVIPLVAQWHCHKSAIDAIYRCHLWSLFQPLGMMLGRTRPLLLNEDSASLKEQLCRYLHFGYLACRDTVLPRLKQLIARPGSCPAAHVLLYVFETQLPAVVYAEEVCRAGRVSMFTQLVCVRCRARISPAAPQLDVYVDEILPRLFSIQSCTGKVRYRHAILYQLSLFLHERDSAFWPLLTRALPNLDEAVVEIFHSKLASALPKNMMNLDGILRTAVKIDDAMANTIDFQDMHLPEAAVKSRPPNHNIGYSPTYAGKVHKSMLFVSSLLLDLEDANPAAATIAQTAQSASGGQIDFADPTLGLLTAAQMPPWLKRPSMRFACAATVHAHGCGVGGALIRLACGHSVDESCIGRSASGRGKNLTNCGRSKCVSLFPVQKESVFKGKSKDDAMQLRADRRALKVQNAADAKMSLCCSICHVCVAAPCVMSPIVAAVAAAATTSTSTAGVVQLVDCAHVFHLACLRDADWDRCGVCCAIADEVVRVSVSAAARVFSAECLDAEDEAGIAGDQNNAVAVGMGAINATGTSDEFDGDSVVSDLAGARQMVRQAFQVSKGVNPYSDMTPKDRGMYQNLLPSSRAVNMSAASKSAG